MPAEDLQLKKLFGDRSRTNLLKKYEQYTITKLLPLVPERFTPNTLTGIGLFGSVIVFTAFALSKFQGAEFLWIVVLGFAINWLGDSLDGRLAYHRNIPRKWYGFSLDIVMDWLSTILIGAGSMIYSDNLGKAFTFAVIVMYGWAMILTLLRYKITGAYRIDSGLIGPTEFRVILSAIVISETFFEGLLTLFLGAIAVLLFIVNILETKKLLMAADIIDRNHAPPAL